MREIQISVLPLVQLCRVIFICLFFYFAGLLLRFSLQHKGKKEHGGYDDLLVREKKKKKKRVGKDLACKDSACTFAFKINK
jgi:hypothetical protein